MGYGLIGAGKIKIATFDETLTFGKRAFRDVLNASKLSYSFTEQKETMPDYRSPAGGNYDAYPRIDTVTVQIELLELTSKNLALALWGEEAALTATPITGEAHKIHAGAFVPADRIIDTSVAVVVKKGATTVSASDYTVSPGGLTFAGAISTVGVTTGDDVTFDYTPLAGAGVQVLTGSAPEVSIMFEGYNRNTGKYRTAKIWRVKLGVASGIDNIGTSYIPLALTGEVIKDESITGEGLSQFIELEEPVTA